MNTSEQWIADNSKQSMDVNSTSSECGSNRSILSEGDLSNAVLLQASWQWVEMPVLKGLQVATYFSTTEVENKRHGQVDTGTQY
jgi:hypothetical protein